MEQPCLDSPLCMPPKPPCRDAIHPGGHAEDMEPKSRLCTSLWLPRRPLSLFFFLNGCTPCPSGVRGPERGVPMMAGRWFSLAVGPPRGLQAP